MRDFYSEEEFPWMFDKESNKRIKLSEELEYNDDETFSLTAKGFEQLQSGKIEDFTDEELLMLRFIDGREKRELSDPTTEELERVMRWYEEVMLNLGLLEMVLKNNAYIDLDDEGEPVFSLTEKGRESAEKLGL